VQVHSDLNVDKVDQQQLAYGKVGVPLTEKKSVESLKGTGAVSGGAAGAAGNLPSYAGGGGTNGSGNNNYKNTTTDSTLGVDKTITKTVKAAGAVNRMDVAVLLDKSVDPKLVSGLKASLASAAGLQIKQRGDTLAVTTGLAFAKQPTAAAKAGPIPAAFAGILKGVGIGLGALAFLFFVTRHLRRRERAELADEPSWLKALEAQQAKQIMPMPDFGDPPATDVVIANADPRRQHLDAVIQQEPERVAAHLRTWITEDSK
jgi:flagellar M-ring protein FliF